MTVTTTQRENLSPRNGRSPRLDSPAVSARARARIATTQSDGNKVRHPRFLRPITVPHWRTWAINLATLRTLWQQSAIDPKRIPDNNLALRWAWQVSNWTDRLLLLAVITVLPTLASRPLRWAVLRPTRRHGIYLTVAALAAAYLLGRKY